MALFYPPVGFHFIVIFDPSILLKYPGIPDIGFQEVSGISSNIPTESYQEGGENRFSHRLPQPVSYSNITLKRGMLIGSSMMRWYKDATESFTFQPFDMTLVLLNSLHIPIQGWSFIQAYPVKWDISGINAQDNSIVVDSVELSYQYFKRLDPTDLLPI